MAFRVRCKGCGVVFTASEERRGRRPLCEDCREERAAMRDDDDRPRRRGREEERPARVPPPPRQSYWSIWLNGLLAGRLFVLPALCCGVFVAFGHKVNDGPPIIQVNNQPPPPAWQNPAPNPNPNPGGGEVPEVKPKPPEQKPEGPPKPV